MRMGTLNRKVTAPHPASDHPLPRGRGDGLRMWFIGRGTYKEWTRIEAMNLTGQVEAGCLRTLGWGDH